jgi:hypothetical protein
MCLEPQPSCKFTRVHASVRAQRARCYVTLTSDKPYGENKTSLARCPLNSAFVNCFHHDEKIRL